ncbi:MAG: hypothetical protein HRT81_00845 [Henriciella sp.]|nr:hypothetical protein [Henriciella sp.]
MPWRRILFGFVATFILGVSVAIFVLAHRTPDAQVRTEIYRGVYLTVEDLPETHEARGKVMIVEVHWDTPGVRIENRPFDFDVRSDDPTGAHYKLQFADAALWRSGAAVLMNTCLFHPGSITSAIPGKAVRSIETMVVDGEVSHLHEHSYLLYWDAAMAAEFLLEKPPSADSLDRATLGLGVQGVQVRNNQPVPIALSSVDEVFARTFIGIDPEARVLYLMAFEHVSGHYMIDRAVRAGVVFGGQLDSGSSTNMLIGPDARGVGAHSGIRNLRPLGPYMMIFADPL